MGDSLYIAGSGDAALIMTQGQMGSLILTRDGGFFGIMSDAAHVGAVDEVTGMMSYQKQVVTALIAIAAAQGNADILAVLHGMAGIAAFPAGAVAANDVSLAEVIRYIQEAVRKGGGSLEASRSLVDAIGSNGTTLSKGSGSILGASGTQIVYMKEVMGTAIPNNAQTLAIFGASGGDLLVEDVIIQIDATGWCGGGAPPVGTTNLEFTTNNVRGLTGVDAPVILETEASFAANSTFIASRDGDTKRLPFVLESGKYLYLHGDDGVGELAGTGGIHIIARRLADGVIVPAGV